MIRVGVDAKNAGCSGNPGHPVLPGKIAASGFTGIDDVWVGLDGALYVTELEQARDLQPGERDRPGVHPRHRPRDPGEGQPPGPRSHRHAHRARCRPSSDGDGHVYVTDLSLIGAVLTKIS